MILSCRAAVFASRYWSVWNGSGLPEEGELAMKYRCSCLPLVLLAALTCSASAALPGTPVDSIDVVMTPLADLQAHNVTYIFDSATPLDPCDIVALDRSVGIYTAVFGAAGIGVRHHGDPNTLLGADIDFAVPGPGDYVIRVNSVLVNWVEQRLLRLYLNGDTGVAGDAIYTTSYEEDGIADIEMTLEAADLTDNMFTLNVRGAGTGVAYIQDSIEIWDATDPLYCSMAIDRGYQLNGDFNIDCRINLADFSEMVNNFGRCNRPGDPNCIVTWPE